MATANLISETLRLLVPIVGGAAAGLVFAPWSALVDDAQTKHDVPIAGDAPVAHDGEKLELVQVVFRHGARTPLGKRYWPGFVDKWDVCGSAYTPVPVRFTLEDGSPAPENPDDLRQVATRYEGGCSKGELTRLGQLQARDLGAWLRSRYVDDLRFVDGAFDPDEVVARTTNYSRTRATLAGVLTGLFPSFGEDELDAAEIAAREERGRRAKEEREREMLAREKELEKRMEEAGVKEQETREKAKATLKDGPVPRPGDASVFFSPDWEKEREAKEREAKERRERDAERNGRAAAEATREEEAARPLPRRRRALRYIPAKTVLDMDEILFSNVKSCGRLASLIQEMFAQHKADFAAREDVLEATEKILAILKADGEKRGVAPDLGKPLELGPWGGKRGDDKKNRQGASQEQAATEAQPAASSAPPSASAAPPAAARPPPASLPVSFLELHDAMTSLAAHGKYVPPALTEDAALQHKIEELAVDAFMYVVAPPGATGSHEEVLRLGSGRMLAMLVGHMNEVVAYDRRQAARGDGKAGSGEAKGAGASPASDAIPLPASPPTSRPPLMRLYSGHDSTILPLLAAVGGTVDHWPRYAACVVFELWRSEATGSYSVRMLYDGAPFPIMNDGGKGVELGKFERDVLGDLALPSTEAYDKACVVHPKHTGPAGETLEARQGGVTIGSSISEE